MNGILSEYMWKPQTFMQDKISSEAALEQASVPLKKFMYKQTRKADLELMFKLSAETLPEKITDSIKKDNIYAVSVLSGNRNFEGRISPLIKANYLASPPLVVAYALAGSMHFDLYKDYYTVKNNKKSNKS